VPIFSLSSDAVFLDVLANHVLHRYHQSADLLALQKVRVVLPTKRACRQFIEAIKRQTTTPVLFPQTHTLTETLNTTEQELQTDDLSRLLRFFSFIEEFPHARSLALSPHTLFSSLPALMALLEEAFLYEMPESPAGPLSDKAEFFCALYKAVAHSPTLMATLKSVQRLATLKEMEMQIRIHPEDPVVLAGITAIFPRMLEFFQLVGEGAHNMIVLPEVVPHLSTSLPPDHPQYALYTILEKLTCRPEEVIPLGERGRDRLRPILQALTEETKVADRGPRSLPPDHISLVETSRPQEEAFIIALLLRETYATSSQTAALITSDVDLVQRVEAHLKRWNLTADVSQARSLAFSSVGVFALLCAELMEENFADMPLLALLKHPLSCFSLTTALTFEQHLRRGTLTSLLEEPSVSSYIKELVTTAPLETARFSDFVLFHERLLMTFLALTQPISSEIAALIAFFQRLKEMPSFSLSRSAYRRLFASLLKTETQQERGPISARLFIWGALEARLLRVDRLILGGLNEETWCPPKDHWVSSKDLQSLNLPFQNQKIGFLMHDFVAALGAQEVFLTRSCAVQDRQVTSVPWLKRLEAYFGDLHPWRERAAFYKQLALCAYGQGEKRTSERPSPCPPSSARPTTLPVTHIALLMRNPYAVYARHILGLVPQEDLSDDPTPLLRGKYVHTVLEYMAHHLPKKEEDARTFLNNLLHRKFPLPESLLYWKYRLENIFEYCLQKFLENRQQKIKSYTEIRGTLGFPDFNFTLTGVADRIDVFPSGSVRIIDYKTGTLPSQEEIQRGLAPQLPLEAAIATFGAFPPLKATYVEALAFWHLKGNCSSCAEVMFENVDAESARAGLVHLLETYQTCAYPAYPAEATAPTYDAYAHLARVKEWI
jgi:ATP-dependent helicase/nuclease subunit B